MASPSGSNNRKRHRQISLVEMCKIPKASKSQSGSTNNTDQDKVAVEVQLCVMKQATIYSQLDAAMLNSQEQWHSFLVRVITSLKFLGECALPVRGHVTDSGLLFKLIQVALVFPSVFHLPVWKYFT